jgi:hypothetical protein
MTKLEQSAPGNQQRQGSAEIFASRHDFRWATDAVFILKRRSQGEAGERSESPLRA